jgi:putative transposase
MNETKWVEGIGGLDTLNGVVNLLSSLSSARVVRHTRGMSPRSINRYKNYRFPAELISDGGWLDYRFCLSYRDVEALLFARGVIVRYEAIRKWCRKFSKVYANQLRHRWTQPGISGIWMRSF